MSLSIRQVAPSSNTDSEVGGVNARGDVTYSVSDEVL